MGVIASILGRSKCTWDEDFVPQISIPSGSEQISEETQSRLRSRTLIRLYVTDNNTQEDITSFFENQFGRTCTMMSQNNSNVTCVGQNEDIGTYWIIIQPTDDQRITRYGVNLEWELCTFP
jgi:hypothetical protein